jgi:transposase
VSDDLWVRVAPLLPLAPGVRGGGRTRAPDRPVFEAIVYVLRTGIQ